MRPQLRRPAAFRYCILGGTFVAQSSTPCVHFNFLLFFLHPANTQAFPSLLTIKIKPGMCHTVIWDVQYGKVRIKYETVYYIKVPNDTSLKKANGL
jgi:hypothetical protein